MVLDFILILDHAQDVVVIVSLVLLLLLACLANWGLILTPLIVLVGLVLLLVRSVRPVGCVSLVRLATILMGVVVWLVLVLAVLPAGLI